MAEKTGSEVWLVRPVPRPAARTRLFCIPYAGSGAAAYRGWAESLESLDVSYVQLPGRENRLREEPFSDLPMLIGALAAALEGWLDRPYAFYGHSLGGLIAFELARTVRSLSWREPSHLFISANRAPHLPRQHPAMRHLPDIELLNEVHRRYGSVPPEILQNAEVRQLLVPGLRADLTLLETYRYAEAEPLGCGITCFGGSEDTMVSRDALEQWREHCKRDFRLQMLEGGHLFHQTARPSLFAAINAALGTSPVAAAREEGAEA
jgi:medium-chain acyl-[acyl-carrier-protein] hydrolase